MKTEIKYIVYGEGHFDRDPFTEEDTYFGKIYISEVTFTVIDRETREYDYSQPTDYNEYVTSKWGGKTLVNFPEYFQPEFGNGLVEHGEYPTLRQAVNSFKELTKGTVDYNVYLINNE